MLPLSATPNTKRLQGEAVGFTFRAGCDGRLINKKGVLSWTATLWPGSTLPVKGLLLLLLLMKTHLYFCFQTKIQRSSSSTLINVKYCASSLLAILSLLKCHPHSTGFLGRFCAGENIGIPNRSAVTLDQVEKGELEGLVVAEFSFLFSHWGSRLMTVWVLAFQCVTWLGNIGVKSPKPEPTA